MIGWIARDKDGDLVFFDEQPYRDGEIWNARFSASSVSVVLGGNFFNYRIEWEDEPIKVEITLKEVAE